MFFVIKIELQNVCCLVFLSGSMGIRHIETKLIRNVQWIVFYKVLVFYFNLKSKIQKKRPHGTKKGSFSGVFFAFGAFVYFSTYFDEFCSFLIQSLFCAICQKTVLLLLFQVVKRSNRLTSKFLFFVRLWYIFFYLDSCMHLSDRFHLAVMVADIKYILVLRVHVIYYAFKYLFLFHRYLVQDNMNHHTVYNYRMNHHNRNPKLKR